MDTPPDRTRRSALDGHVVPGRHGASGREEAVVVLEELRPGALVQLNGVSEPASFAGLLSRLGIDGAPQPRRGLTGSKGELLWTGADQWWLVDREGGMSAAEALALLEVRRAPDATALDLGHARTVLRVSGPMARDLLAKGCPLDVDGLRVGDCASTRLGPFNVVLHCAGTSRFDLYVFRSFGLAMWEWLNDEAAEFGCEVRRGA